MARNPEEIMKDVEAALGRSNTFDALKFVVELLREIMSGTTVVTDTDLTDEIKHFAETAEEKAEKGDAAGAKKAKGKAAMLRSAETLVNEADKADKPE